MDETTQRRKDAQVADDNSMIPNTDQPAYRTWVWQITKRLGLPASSATEQNWLDLPESTRESFRQGAAAIDSMLIYLTDKLAQVEIDTGSEHFRHGQETMLDTVKALVRDTHHEIYSDTDWRTP